MKMKFYSIVYQILFIIIVPQIYYSQETSICEMIDKKTYFTLSKYGKPQFHDKSSPYAKCIFYKKTNVRLASIADNTGVYQIQADYFYNNEVNAYRTMNNYLLEFNRKEFKINTLNANVFKILADGIKMELTLFNNTYAGQYEVKFKIEKSGVLKNVLPFAIDGLNK